MPIVKASALSRIKSWSSEIFSSLVRSRNVTQAASKSDSERPSADPGETIEVR
jgi:hypothetical protein